MVAFTQSAIRNPKSAIQSDGLNRRIQKTDKTGASDVTYDFYYNTSWQVLEVRRSQDTDPYKQYVWGVRYIDAPVCRDEDTGDGSGGDPDGDCIDSDDEHLYYTQDANFNVTALVDADDGDVVERYMYSPYGEVEVLDADWSADADGQSDYGNEVLYCGYYHDWETGLYHVRHRYYHPPLGRWTSRDPIGYADGMALYEYGRSGPTGGVDPLGKVVQFDKIGGSYADLLHKKEKRFVYTCKCGWRDRGHMGSGLGPYWSARQVIDTAIRTGRKQRLYLTYGGAFADTMVHFIVNPQGQMGNKPVAYGPDDPRKVALGIVHHLFLVGEAHQYDGLWGGIARVFPKARSVYTIEDLPSNWAGLMAAVPVMERGLAGKLIPEDEGKDLSLQGILTSSSARQGLQKNCGEVLSEYRAKCLYLDTEETLLHAKNPTIHPRLFNSNRWAKPTCGGQLESPIFDEGDRCLIRSRVFGFAHQVPGGVSVRKKGLSELLR